MYFFFLTVNAIPHTTMKSQLWKENCGQAAAPTHCSSAVLGAELCKRKALNYLALFAPTRFILHLSLFSFRPPPQCYYFLKSGVGAGSVTIELDHNAYFSFLFRFVETWFHGAQVGQTHSVWGWPWTPEPPSISRVLRLPCYSVPPLIYAPLGFELRASYLLGQFSTDWATSAAQFLLLLDL